MLPTSGAPEGAAEAEAVGVLVVEGEEEEEEEEEEVSRREGRGGWVHPQCKRGGNFSLVQAFESRLRLRHAHTHRGV